MFFNDASEIKNIASRTGCAVFVVPDSTKVEIKNAYVLEPTTKTVISIDDIKELIQRLGIRQTSEQFIIIRPADLLGLDAANALLKNLEEPQDKVHFVLITSSASRIIPTILSRSSIYFLRKDEPIDGPIDADKKMMTVLGTAIEILYKSYYKTGKDVFIKKLPKFLTAYENIDKNGHVKLHIVADLC